MITFNTALIVTPLGFITLVGDRTALMSWNHIAAGFSLSLFFPVHIFPGKTKTALTEQAV